MGHKLKTEICNFFVQYDTPRMVQVQDKKIGLTFRLIQLGVLGYIIGWVFLYEKGYQDIDDIISSVSIKVKGIAVTNLSGIGTEIWDVADYVFPPEGDSSFVVMTNFIITPEQQMGTCNELPDIAPCNSSEDCEAISLRLGQGILTGNCTPIDNNTNDIKSCEVFSWCPVENDHNIPNPPLLLQAENFTLFIKNSINFPKHKVNRQNLVESVTSDHLKTCVFDEDKDPLCPVFRIGYIVQQTGQKFSDIAYKGGTISILIDWQCDLDWAVKHCIPTYTFQALNDENSASQGFNFRHARYYKDNNKKKRTLFKVFGIRFNILVNGQGGKFNIIPTMTTIGSGIGIFGVATVVCDLMLLHVLPKRNYYKEKKFKHAKNEEKKTLNKEDGIGFSINNQQDNSLSSGIPVATAAS